MSKTVDELVKVFKDVERHEYLWNLHRGHSVSIDDVYRACIAAVVRALRDEMYCSDDTAKLDDILGDAGEKVAAGGSGITKHPDVTSPATDLCTLTEAQHRHLQYKHWGIGSCDCEMCKPATDPSFGVEHRSARLAEEVRLLQWAWKETPVTTPAPAVCMWKLVDEDVVESGCGQPWSAKVMRNICPSCGKPIAFTEAK